MVSGIGFGEGKSRPYRKRRPMPALIVILVLCLGALFVWINAITSKTEIDDAVRCSPAATAPAGTTFTALSHSALADTMPMAPSKVALKVLNAGTTRGQGAITTETLRSFGFTQVAAPENDSAYQNKVPKCRGQLRFGTNGMSAARTIILLTPCMELIKDTRTDNSVDLAIGDTFGQIQPKSEAREVLKQLTDSANQHQGGGEQSLGAIPPTIDKNLLNAAQDVSC